jgi:hypothetical protein
MTIGDDCSQIIGLKTKHKGMRCTRIFKCVAVIQALSRSERFQMQFFNTIKTSAHVAAILAFILVLSSSALADQTHKPVFSPALEISKTSQDIDIDGHLNDPGWEQAVRLDNFVETYPGDNIQPVVETIVMVTYDEDNLYVAFVCQDDPNALRATMCQRDQYNGDDAVSVLVDTYGEASWAYKFHVNPYGVQRDFLWTNVIGDDLGYDIIWNSAAKITGSGYQVEMAVPFASIRFPNEDMQTWKINFRRNYPRESYHQFSWAANDRNEQCGPCQWGTINGIRDVHPGRGIEILPSFIASQSSEVTDAYNSEIPFNDGSISGEVSLGGKYSINSDVTLEATVNPDFSQIEADAAQIDVNTPVALFFPERRPFFQEGRDIFRTLFNSFYTRTINDPQFAAKLTGRSGKYRFGMVSAVDENSYYLVPFEEGSERPFNVGRSYVNVFRGLRSFGEGSQLGFIINDRHFEEGGYNSIFALDQRIRLSRNYSIDGQYIMTLTKEPDDSALYYNPGTFDNDKHTFGFDGESYTGYGLISRFLRNARHWNFMLDFNQVGWSYRTQTGYDPWVDYRNLSFWTGYNIYFEDGFFERITPQVYTETRWNFEGERKWTHVNIALESRIRSAQTYFSVAYIGGDESWSGKRFDNLWHAHFDVGSALSSRLSYYLSGEMGVGPALNVLEKGNEISLATGLDIKPLDRLIIEPNFNYLKSARRETNEELFEDYVLRTRFSLQATKSLSVRLVVQYEHWEMLYPMSDGEEIEEVILKDRHWDIDPLIMYKLNPFTVFYFGSTMDYDRLPYDTYPFYSPQPDPNHKDSWNLSSRQFFMKLQYLFQT